MKKLIVAFVIGLLSMGTSFAASNPGLANEINEKVVIDLSDIELDQYSTDYVLVSFKIENGQIKINEIQGSQVELKKLIIKRLVQMNIESNYNADETYRYKFTFEKV
jgi:hypothetical protein